MNKITTRSSVLLLVTDQHRVDMIGCHGSPVCETLMLDRPAAEGTRFDQCDTSTAICSPVETSLLTGVLPFRNNPLVNFERNVEYIPAMFERGPEDHGASLSHVDRTDTPGERSRGNA